MTKQPNFIIAGVNKAGTTSLFSYLTSHPDVSGAKIKETCYFLPVRYGKPLDQFDNYLSLFDQKSSSSIVMEATPGYFYGGQSLAMEIDRRLPSVKIAIVLRDPASRLISFFSFMKSMLLIDQSMEFRDYVSQCQSLSLEELKSELNNPYFGVEGGFYSRYLNDWKNQFGDRLKILFFEDLKDNPRACVQDLSRWLGIDKTYFDSFEFTVDNKTSQYRIKELHRLSIYTNKRLEAVFRQFPRLKQNLRKVYGRLNLSDEQLSINLEDRSLAQSLYQESNLELRAILQSDSSVTLPPWLESK